MPLNLNSDNPVIVVKQDTLPLQVITGSSFYIFTGVTPTVVTDTVSGIYHTISIFTPSGASGQDGTSGATPTLTFNGSGSTVVATQISGTTYTINIFSPSGATGQDGQDGASGITPTFIFLGSGTTVVNYVKSGTTYSINVYAPSGATGASGATGQDGASGQTVVNYYTFIPSGATVITTGNTNTVTIYTPTGGTLPTFLTSRAVITDMSGNLTTANTTSTEIAYLFGVTSSVQTQLNNRSLTTHTHTSLTGLTITEAQVTNLPTDLSYLQSQIDDLSAIQSIGVYYVEHQASDIGGYESLVQSPVTISGNSEVININNNTVLFDAYSTPSGGLGVTGITSGLWTMHGHFQFNSVTGSNYIHWDLYKRTTGGTETLLFRMSTPDINVTTLTEYQIEAIQPAFTGFVPTDRLVMKIYAQTTGGAKTATMQYASTTTYGFMQSPLKVNSNPLWSSIIGKPAWISGTTLSAFEAQHAHSTLYQTKALTVTGITSMGTGTTIVHGTPVAGNKVQVKSLKGAGSISITSDATTVTISGSTIDAFATVSDGYLMARNGNAITGVTQTKFPLATAITTYTGTTAPATYLPKVAVIKTVTGTTYTALSADNGKILELTATGATTITLPSGTTLATGWQATFINYGGASSAAKTFAAQSGASIKSKGAKLKLETQYDGASAYYRGTNVWVLIGDLT